MSHLVVPYLQVAWVAEGKQVAGGTVEGTGEGMMAGDTVEGTGEGMVEARQSGRRAGCARCRTGAVWRRRTVVAKVRMSKGVGTKGAGRKGRRLARARVEVWCRMADSASDGLRGFAIPLLQAHFQAIRRSIASI